MDPKIENAVIVTGVQRETVPSDRLFAEKGKPVALGAVPWDFEQFTGEKSGSSVMVRAEVTVPRDGWYTLGAGADYWLKVWIDGVLRLDIQGDYPPGTEDQTTLVELKAGKHIVDVNFSRGVASALMALSLTWAKEKLDSGVDLEAPEGRINPYLHGSNTTLLLSSRKLIQYDEALRNLKFKLSRTHDWALWNSGQRIIDTHFIFPMMKLDPKDPSNYYFKATDEILRLTQEEGKMEVFYRLGTSIEHTGSPHFNTIPPSDPDKYAEVLAGIVRHYTKGWADGYHWNIRCWEIWNEPDGGENMWNAPYETFIPFFVTVLKRLKSEFPDLQFGGPAMVKVQKSRFLDLLRGCKEAGIEPDFISWHCYNADPDDLIRQPVKMRRFLDEAGFSKTRLCIDEWHYLEESWFGVTRSGDPEKIEKAQKVIQGIDSAVFNLAVLCGWQYGPLDLAMWYGFSFDSVAWGYRDAYRRFTKNYYSLELFGRFLRDYTERCNVGDTVNSIHLLAGKSADGSKAGILAADFKGGETELKIPVKGIEKYSRVSAVVLDETRNNESVSVTVRDGCLILRKNGPGSAAFSVSLEK